MFPSFFDRTPDEKFETRRKLDVIFRWCRACALCSSVRPPIDLICEKCLEDLHPFINRGDKLLQPGYPFPVYSLFTWDEKANRFVKPLLHAFKRGWAAQAAMAFVETLSDERQNLTASQFDLVYPSFIHPPASNGGIDHSWLLAQSFSRYWQTDVLALEGKSQKSRTPQKKQKVGERSNRRFVSIAQEKFSRPGTPFVFVDDVITSGSTAMAAYMALGDPPKFEAWTLVCRPKLAGKSRF